MVSNGEKTKFDIFWQFKTGGIGALLHCPASNGMNFFGTIILGIVEGVTEFLPISSTGHLILAGVVLKLQQTEFLKSFEIAIQLGAILSVVVLYWRKLLVDREILARVVVAFLPTAVLGLVFYSLIKKYLLGSSDVVIWALFLGGVALIGFEIFIENKSDRTNKTNDNDGLAVISFKQGFLIGLFQSIAMVPGVSRAAATIIGGLALGINRKTIVEFSFLLAVPTMAAATGLDLIKSAGAFSSGDLAYLTVGFIVSFVTALVAIKFLLAFIKKHNFVWFGIYRIAAAIVFWLIM